MWQDANDGVVGGNGRDELRDGWQVEKGRHKETEVGKVRRGEDILEII